MKKVTDAPRTQQKSDHLLGLVDPYNIQEAAYYKWLHRGQQEGDAVKDWLVAELELRTKLDREK